MSTLDSNELVWDLDVRLITVWDLSNRNEDNKIRTVEEIPNQYCKR